MLKSHLKTKPCQTMHAVVSQESWRRQIRFKTKGSGRIHNMTNIQPTKVGKSTCATNGERKLATSPIVVATPSAVVLTSVGYSSGTNTTTVAYAASITAREVKSSTVELMCGAMSSGAKAAVAIRN